MIDGLALNTRLTGHTYRDIVTLAQRYHVQAKDVPYFELARILDIPIAAFDGGITEACKVHGVPLLRFN